MLSFCGTLWQVLITIYSIAYVVLLSFNFESTFRVNGQHMIVSLYLLKGGGPRSKNILICIHTYTCQHIQTCVGEARSCLIELVLVNRIWVQHVICIHIFPSFLEVNHLSPSNSSNPPQNLVNMKTKVIYFVLEYGTFS